VSITLPSPDLGRPAVLGLVKLIEQRLQAQRVGLVQIREQVAMLDAQIADFIRERREPARDPGLFLTRVAVQLRAIATEIDGSAA
jgi:hypothetical protein